MEHRAWKAGADWWNTGCKAGADWWNIESVRQGLIGET